MRFFQWPLGFKSSGAETVNGYSNSNKAGGGSSGGGGPTPPSGGGRGGGGGDGRRPAFTCDRGHLTQHGYSEDMTNLVDANARLNAYTTEMLNEEARARYGQNSTQVYQDNDYGYEGKANPSPNPDLPVIRFHADPDKPQGYYHGSIQEMERSMGLRFHAAGYDNVSIAVQKHFSMPQPPQYSSEARVTPRLQQVQISHTYRGSKPDGTPIRGHQQAIFDPVNTDYSETKSIDNLFDWLKFKP